MPERPQPRIIGQDSLVIGDQIHPIELGEIITPNREYSIHTFQFKDERGRNSDGALFRIKPGGSTRVQRIIDDAYTSEKIAFKGSGTFLGISPEGTVKELPLDASHEENPLVIIGPGWVECWVAGQEGLEVVDVSTPPFREDMEKEIPYMHMDNALGLSEFWSAFNRTKQG